MAPSMAFWRAAERKTADSGTVQIVKFIVQAKKYDQIFSQHLLKFTEHELSVCQRWKGSQRGSRLNAGNELSSNSDEERSWTASKQTV